MSKKTVSVNGVIYHKKTGMPLREERGTHHADHSARAVHGHVQKSRTLNRKYVTKSHSQPVNHAPKEEVADHTPITISVHKQHSAPTAAPKSTAISRFTPHHTPSSAKPKRSMSDIAPMPHHLMRRVEEKLPVAQKPLHHPAHVLKQMAIDKAMSEAPSRATRKDVKPVKAPGKFARLASLASASMAVLLLGAYFTYLNMPALSTRVAAAQAGINASYPGYQPMGYGLNGPVAYKQGSVTMSFAAHGGPQNFTLSQTKSGLDSLAILDTVVTPRAGTRYQTTSSGGLTVYTYTGGAVWVNGGILYQINGDANLSPEQVQRIATSL